MGTAAPVTDTPLFDQLRTLTVDVLELPPDQVVPDAHFADDLGADSLDLVELVEAIEAEFGVRIDDERARRHHHRRRGLRGRQRQARLTGVAAAFEGEQVALDVEATAVAAERPAGAQHPVARHDDRDRVRRHGRPDGPAAPAGCRPARPARRTSGSPRRRPARRAARAPSGGSRPTAGGRSAGRSRCRWPSKYSSSCRRASSSRCGSSTTRGETFSASSSAIVSSSRGKATRTSPSLRGRQGERADRGVGTGHGDLDEALGVGGCQGRRGRRGDLGLDRGQRGPRLAGRRSFAGSCQHLPEPVQARLHALAGGRLGAVEDGSDLVVAPVVGVAERHRDPLLLWQRPHGVPQRRRRLRRRRR